MPLAAREAGAGGALPSGGLGQAGGGGGLGPLCPHQVVGPKHVKTVQQSCSMWAKLWGIVWWGMGNCELTQKAGLVGCCAAFVPIWGADLTWVHVDYAP